MNLPKILIILLSSIFLYMVFLFLGFKLRNKNIKAQNNLGTGTETQVCFNWPYDYFSLVELIKLETKIDSFNFSNE